MQRFALTLISASLLVASPVAAFAETTPTTTQIVAISQTTGEIKLANQVVLQVVNRPQATTERVEIGTKVQLSYRTGGALKPITIHH